ncbi:MAG: hypothetical protein Ct9H90mP7_5270 [Candidatus Neomarinimicrobiota bacterium]|nr:MAG: hypothetical protein Ct9H90mP7_5270 [Candidatus Neomarinimicrobiota bacterium]
MNMDIRVDRFLKNGIPTTMSLSYAHNQVIDIDEKNFKVVLKNPIF